VIYFLGCLIIVYYVVKLERVLCRNLCGRVWRGGMLWLGALFSFFFVRKHFLGVLLNLSLFFGFLFLLCCFLPLFLLPLDFYREKVGLLWIGVREGWKAVRVLGVATLVLLDHYPLKFPPFCEGMDLGSLFSIWASPCELVATFDISFFHFVLFPSSFRPLALRRNGGIFVDWCLRRRKSNVSYRGGHPSPSQWSSHAVPPFLRRHRVGEACSLFEPPLVTW